jgi:hypothetical protein
VVLRSALFTESDTKDVVVHKHQYRLESIRMGSILIPKFCMAYIRDDCMFIMNNRSAGPMARRLTTNQEIAGSIPASINSESFTRVRYPFAFST